MEMVGIKNTSGSKHFWSYQMAYNLTIRLDEYLRLLTHKNFKSVILN